MPRISSLKYYKVVKKLRKLGFIFRRSTGGTHEIWWNEKKRKTCVVPHHHDIKPGIIRSILKQADVSIDEFLRL